MKQSDQTEPAVDHLGQPAPTMQARARLAQAIDELAAPIAFWDQDMVNTYANAAYASWFNTTPRRMYGVHFKQLLGEHAFQRDLPSLNRALSGLAETYETRLRGLSGAVRDIHVTLTPLIIEGTVTGFSVLFVDLTARVHAEAELRAARETAAASRVYERIEAQLHQVALQELYAAELALSVAIKAAPTEIEPSTSFAISSIDHAITEVRATVRPLPDTDVAAQADGRNGKTQPTSLATAPTTTTVAFDALPDATAVLDADGGIVATNLAWRMFSADNGGTPESTDVGVNYLGVCDRSGDAQDGDAQRFSSALSDVLAGVRAEAALDYPCPAPDKPRWFSVHISSLSGLGGAAVVAHRDITSKKIAEQDLPPITEMLDPLTA
jgi:PAS domain S-box-containing protein